MFMDYISYIWSVGEDHVANKARRAAGIRTPTDARNKSSLSPVPSRHVLSECSLSSLELFSRFPSFRYPYYLVSSQRRSAAPHGCSRVNPFVPCPLVIFYIFGNMVCARTLAQTRSPASGAQKEQDSETSGCSSSMWGGRGYEGFSARCVCEKCGARRGLV